VQIGKKNDRGLWTLINIGNAIPLSRFPVFVMAFWDQPGHSPATRVERLELRCPAGSQMSLEWEHIGVWGKLITLSAAHSTIMYLVLVSREREKILLF
jgi:hypothetical protein